MTAQRLAGADMCSAPARERRPGYVLSAGGDGLTLETAAYLIEQMLAAIEPGMRKAAALELVNGLENLYVRYDVPRPAWLSAVRDEYKGTANRDLPTGRVED